MVSEDVVVRIYGDSIVTVGTFQMVNQGKTVDVQVGFPWAGFTRFRAFVNGRLQNVRDGQKEYPRPDGSTTTGHWKLWDVNFASGQSCEIRVEYKTKASMMAFWFRDEEAASVPADVLETMRKATIRGNAEYTLETGSPWKGKLDHCKVAFEFVDIPHVHIKKRSPEDGAITKNSVVWEYKDYEPARWVDVEYFISSLEQQTEILDGLLERFPGNAPLASAVGRFYGAYLNRDDLKRDLYHSFLAKWDEPIPQLMEYASGGRCRVDYGNKKGILTVWSMAYNLFREYREKGELETGRDIAPTVSRISSAYVDSLSTCNNLPQNDQWLLREATSLRDLCNGLMK
jgi:hypothetical protein